MAQRVKRWRVVWTEPAREDLREIFRFIWRQNPGAARKVIDDLREKTDRLAQFPLSGRDLPELAGAGLREVLVGTYRVIYRVNNTTVEVLTIVHGRRKVGS